MIVVTRDEVFQAWQATVTETPNSSWSTVIRECPLHAVEDALTNALFWFHYPEPVARPPKTRRRTKQRKAS